MKHLRKHPCLLWAALLAALLMTSCDNDDNADSLPGEMIEVRVATPQITENDESSEITKSGAEAPKAQTLTVAAGNGMVLEATLIPDSVPATRGTTVLDTGVKYRVIAFKQGDVSAAGYISHADYEAGTAEPIAGKLQVPAGKTCTFVCYSLGNTAALPAFDKNYLTLDADIDTSDLLYRKADYTITSPYTKIYVSLTNMETQITLIVQSDYYQVKKEITDISGTINAHKQARIDLTTGKINPRDNKKDIAIPWDATTLGSMRVASKKMYIFGNSYNPTFIIYNLHSITAGGVTTHNLKGEFAYYPSYTLDNKAYFLPGKKYNLELELRNAPPSSDDGISLGGSIWARGNVICTLGGQNYKFASSQEYRYDEGLGLDHWAWRSRDPLTPYYATVYGEKIYYKREDPCGLVNYKWRMPSLTEFKRLIYTGYIKTFKNGVFGIYFGTTTEPAPGTEENYVFLPRGNKALVGEFQIYSGESYYWTNDSEKYKPSSYYPDKAFAFYFDSMYMTGLDPKKYRAAIRCVKYI